jgi:hypothetical protein
MVAFSSSASRDKVSESATDHLMRQASMQIKRGRFCPARLKGKARSRVGAHDLLGDDCRFQIEGYLVPTLQSTQDKRHCEQIGNTQESRRLSFGSQSQLNIDHAAGDEKYWSDRDLFLVSLIQRGFHRCSKRCISLQSHEFI